MYIHKEGYSIITISSIITVLILVIFIMTLSPLLLAIMLFIPFLIVLMGIISFFRIPKRSFVFDEKKIISPADGTIVVIEDVLEKEFLGEKCKQISIFMSPANVHVNRYPISGEIIYSKYHKGKYLVASHPKASTENERTSVCIQAFNGTPILIRQVAGALARRIVCYAKTGDHIKQNDEVGFIKFGSRVDIFIPISSHIQVTLGQKVKNGITVIADLP